LFQMDVMQLLMKVKRESREKATLRHQPPVTAALPQMPQPTVPQQQPAQLLPMQHPMQQPPYRPPLQAPQPHSLQPLMPTTDWSMHDPHIGQSSSQASQVFPSGGGMSTGMQSSGYGFELLSMGMGGGGASRDSSLDRSINTPSCQIQSPTPSPTPTLPDVGVTRTISRASSQNSDNQ
jgi:hypothetical protein